jgi:hypothetical protein
MARHIAQAGVNRAGGLGRWSAPVLAAYAMYRLMLDDEVSVTHLGEVAHWRRDRVRYLLHSLSMRLPLYTDSDGRDDPEQAMDAGVARAHDDVWHICDWATWTTLDEGQIVNVGHLCGEARLIDEP